jgi:L-lactate dehydrogenase complex protein LldF
MTRPITYNIKNSISNRLSDEGVGDAAYNSIRDFNRMAAYGHTYFERYDLARQRASFYRTRAIENTEKVLIDFEFNLIKNNGKVSWILDTDHLHHEITSLINQFAVKSIAYSDVSVIKQSELISKITDTDISLRKISELYNKPTDLAIIGADYAITENSTLVLMDDSPRLHNAAINSRINIFIVSIDKFLQSLSELELISTLYSTNKTGQSFPAHISLFTVNQSLMQENYVFITDFGKSEVLADTRLRQLLNCIDCDACRNVCPVYHWAGDDVYPEIVKGPMGLFNLHRPLESEKELIQLSTRCGSCNDSCPVNIPITELINVRQMQLTEEETTKSEKMTYYFWKNGIEKRSKLEKGGAKLKNFVLRQMFKKSWGEKREFPTIAPKSFNQLWKERKAL